MSHSFKMSGSDGKKCFVYVLQIRYNLSFEWINQKSFYLCIMSDSTEHQIISVGNKQFKLFIRSEEISQAVTRIAHQVNRDYYGKNPVMIGILNGAFIFASDLLRKIDIPCEITFTKYASYKGTATTGEIQTLIGLNKDISGRDVIIIEDIVDTGMTMATMLHEIRILKPASIRIACFCFKPEAFKADFTIDYLGYEIPNLFIVGYGLDYDGYGRNLPEIYQIVK